MFNTKRILSFLLVMVVTISASVNAFAAQAFVAYDNILNQGWNRAYYARDCFTAVGYGINYHYNDYFKSVVQSEIPSIRSFYVDTHGNSSAFSTRESDGSQGIISNTELGNWTDGYYKFAYIDACNCGTTDAFFKAFKMSYDTSKHQAFLGWQVTIYDDWSYTVFTRRVFSDLKAGETLNDSVWNARVESGKTGYAIYGDYFMTMNN